MKFQHQTAVYGLPLLLADLLEKQVPPDLLVVRRDLLAKQVPQVNRALLVLKDFPAQMVL
jgi:hypothetical protein